MGNIVVATIILSACATGALNLPEAGRTVPSGELRLCMMPNGYLKQILIERSSWSPAFNQSPLHNNSRWSFIVLPGPTMLPSCDQLGVASSWQR